MTVARTVRRLAVWSGSAALVVGALALGPARASAQYTLTFDPSTTAGNTMAGNYQGSVPTSEVTIKDGVISNFGGGAVTSYANSTSDCNGRTTTASGGLCFQSGSTYGESGGSSNHVAVAGTYCTDPGSSSCRTSDGTSAVGEFDFTTVGSNVASFISVTVGCDYSLNAVSSNCGQSTINQLELQIWNAAGTTELAYDFDPAFSNTATSSVTLLANQFTTIGGADLSNLGTGFRFEWANVGGSSANCGASCTLADNGSDVFSIDNLKFDSQITPEPGTLALFGTGLVGLAPLMIRRRRRRAA